MAVIYSDNVYSIASVDSGYVAQVKVKLKTGVANLCINGSGKNSLSAHYVPSVEAAEHLISIHRNEGTTMNDDNDLIPTEDASTATATVTEKPAKKKSKKTKSEKTKPTKKKTEGRDSFGCRLGSRAATINSVLSTTPQTTKEITEASKANAVLNHLKKMAEKGHIVKSNDGWALKSEQKPAKKKSKKTKSSKGPKAMSDLFKV